MCGIQCEVLQPGREAIVKWSQEMLNLILRTGVAAVDWCSFTVWPEILAGRYFGGLLKICHLAEFTLAVEPVLAIMIFIAKWLIERAGNLTGP